MWTRQSVKSSAKESLNRSYWGVVLMALIMGLLTGGGSGGSGGGSTSNQSVRDAVGSASSIDARVIIGIIVAVLAIVSVAIIIGLALSIFLLNPLSIGGYRYFVEATYEAKTVSDMKCLGMGFTNGYYKNIVKTMFLKGLYQWLWSLLFVIPGIVKGYEYKMIPYILAENPEVTAEEAFALSKEMMTGEKWNAFVLDLSFIGWIFAVIFTCGIAGIFYVNPYMQLTQAHLYDVLKTKSSIDYFDHSLGGNNFIESTTYDTYQDNSNNFGANDYQSNDMYGNGDMFGNDSSDNDGMF